MITNLDILLRSALPMTFDDSVTGTEMLGKVTAKMNEIIAATNAFLNQSLSDMVAEQLAAWIADDTIDVIISELLQTQIDTVEGEVDILAGLQKMTDIMENQKIIGLIPATSPNLTSLISYGIAYISSKRVEKAELSHTYTASKDTYVDLSSAGVYTFVETTNGGAFPALTADSLRVARVVTNGSSITAVDVYAENLLIGLWAGQYNSKGWKNTMIGYRAGDNNTDGSWNTFLGYYAGQLNTIGGANSFLGYGSGRGNTEGMYNTFVGFETGHLNTEGDDNTFVGVHAGEENLIGNRNTFIGVDAGYNAVADNNTAVGYRAGQEMTDGTENTLIGVNAGNVNAGADGNTLVGFNSGVSNIGIGNTATGARTLLNQTSGFYNVADGFEAGDALTTGSLNTMIGTGAGHGAGQKVDAVNSSAIGAGAVTDKSNSVRLGNADLAVVETYGNLECLTADFGVVLKSPDGTRYKLTVSNAGALVITPA